MIHISVWSALLWLLLLALPLVLFHATGARLFRQTVSSFVSMLVQMGLMGALCWALGPSAHWSLSLCGLLLLSLCATLLTVRRGRLRLRRMLLPMWACQFVSVLLVALYIEGLVLHVDGLFSSRWLLPVGGVLLALCGDICGLSLREYFVGLVRFSSTYYYKVGNGAPWHGAVLPMVKRALERGCRPLLSRMGHTGLMSASLLMCGLLMAGWQPLQAFLTTVALATGAVAVVMLSFVLIIVVTHRLVIGKRGQLKDCVRMKTGKKDTQPTEKEKE